MTKKSGRKKAVALRYRPEKDSAPKVTAKGSGRVADKIIELAKMYGIPVKDDPDLIEVLSKLDIDEQIPPRVYIAVAELLAFVYSLNRKKQPG
ncbi:MAG: EscU/YscU/HrcU family type III secretion system export apparatus switch protein [Deltaproteobacteria bacterium]|nr:EscU/YscU/HrcU family type III secretion system export apparatus switch protein [Deltaproteobacteria bacterium]MBW1960467.1 EscU/YscU/HrcU family type III secretion system export apparatus switch protein [Deltaproteobacteria bacterium]MBW1996247.1 EscU/YscU/HrcU family type III secretion system export apparatus switch protein [Deltaproteobacteria bacterium]MBW2154027.1 EscU/YscU/HrcU family type III secretion system export apparatus switch protein [Deltaproteobacteria bacterium]